MQDPKDKEQEPEELPKVCWDCEWLALDYFYYENAYLRYCGVYCIPPKTTCKRKRKIKV